ncbi:MAG TPA: acyl-CoA reductase, partial [archaeon]|nr:acyl-CoA reductase [archaeon]
LEVLPITTGLSSGMVELSIDTVTNMYDKHGLLQMIESELGESPEVVDRFVPKKGCDDLLVRLYFSKPELVTTILAGNAIGPYSVSLIRDLLVKSATLGKYSQQEPCFVNLYARSLQNVEPKIAETICITYWDHEDREVQKTAFDESDVVVVYGNSRTVDEIRKDVPINVKTIPYGLKIGFSVIGREYLYDEKSALNVAAKLALDASLYNQHACFSPQVVYVEEGGKITPRDFAKISAAEMEKFNKIMPRGKISLDESSEIQQIRGEYEFRDDAGIWCSSPGTDWTVIYEPRKEFELSCGNRVIRVKPISDISEVKDLVKPFGPYLQTIGVELHQDRLLNFSGDMGKIGVNRIVYVGNMTNPKVGESHDGSYGLRDLIVDPRWVTVEKAK